VAKWGVLPDYRLVGISGPDHARVYMVEVTVGVHASAQGAATTKQNAQRAAAARVIGMLAGLEAAEE
jgi:dsRNA-specific ribonuclease